MIFPLPKRLGLKRFSNFDRATECGKVEPFCLAFQCPLSVRKPRALRTSQTVQPARGLGKYRPSTNF